MILLTPTNIYQRFAHRIYKKLLRQPCRRQLRQEQCILNGFADPRREQICLLLLPSPCSVFEVHEGDDDGHDGACLCKPLSQATFQRLLDADDGTCITAEAVDGT